LFYYYLHILLKLRQKTSVLGKYLFIVSGEYHILGKELNTLLAPANVAIEYSEFDFDNEFAHETKYRGPPTPALEKEWQGLWKCRKDQSRLDAVRLLTCPDGPFRIPEEEVAGLNRSADLGGGKALIPADDGSGGYLAMIEVFHQLHCLVSALSCLTPIQTKYTKNMVRQYTWYGWYERHQDIVEMPENLLMGAVGRRMHVDHCIEALRLSLMCQSDTSPVFLVKDPESSLGERAQFSTHHKCRNFEKIREWAVDNKVPE
jgi:hypothetical protein